MSSRASYIELAYSEIWVPKAQAIREAMSVYAEFAHNFGCAEDLARLSHAARSADIDSEAERIFNPNTLRRLAERKYLVSPLGSLSVQLTLKAQVAYNMVEPEVDDGLIVGHLTEPFKGWLVFPELHEAYMKVLEYRRQKDERDYL